MKSVTWLVVLSVVSLVWTLQSCWGAKGSAAVGGNVNSQTPPAASANSGALVTPDSKLNSKINPPGDVQTDTQLNRPLTPRELPADMFPEDASRNRPGLRPESEELHNSYGRNRDFPRYRYDEELRRRRYRKVNPAPLPGSPADVGPNTQLPNDSAR